MTVLIDTNIYAAFVKEKPEVIAKLRQAEHIYLSTIVIGEIISGFRNGTRFEENRQKLESFVMNPYVSILDVTVTTADRFGRIFAQLRRRGTPIPTNDIWIAAHAFESGAELLTLDRHFFNVDGLVLADL